MFHFRWQEALNQTDKVVILTGGTKGVGRAIAARFADAGAQVVVAARKPPEVPLGHFVETDVREPDQLDRLVRWAVDHFRKIDVLVNNAGGTPYALAAAASAKYNDKIMALNLLAPMNLATKVNAVMQAQDTGGAIIN